MTQTSVADFYDTIGIERESAGEGHARLRVANKKGLRNSRGEIHGGVIASLADIAASQAARTLLAPGESLATASITVTFIAPAGDSVLFADAEVLRLGGTLATVTVRLTTSTEDLVAYALGTVRLFRKPKAGSAAAVDHNVSSTQ